MKICPNCGSTTFEDMDRCYDCLYCYASTLEDLPGLGEQALRMVRLKVALQGLYTYEMLLRKQEGASLKIGTAIDSAIVLPGVQTSEYQCSIFFSQGQLWVETADKNRKDIAGEASLVGAKALTPGDSLCLGTATITLLNS